MIVSSNEEEEMSHFISKLHLYRRPFILRNDLNEYKHYLASKLTRQVQECEDQQVAVTSASVVDHEKYVYLGYTVQVKIKFLFHIRRTLVVFSIA